MLVRTYNEYHLGDQLHHLHYLRKVCQLNPDVEATHYCKEEYHPQLLPLLEGVPITLLNLTDKPQDAVNTWINADWYFHLSPFRHRWLEFHLDWFSNLSSRLQVLNPMQTPNSFLFDYPALEKNHSESYDYLIINSEPKSNQVPNFNHQYFHLRIHYLQQQGYTVITTHPTDLCPCTQHTNMTITDIGCLSKNVKHIEAIDTGPIWTTYNIWNANTVLSRTAYTITHQINLLNTQTFPNLPIKVKFQIT
jgi:hypothetical protein